MSGITIILILSNNILTNFLEINETLSKLSFKNTMLLTEHIIFEKNTSLII